MDTKPPLDLNLRQLIRHCRKRADVSIDMMQANLPTGNAILSGTLRLSKERAELLAEHLGVSVAEVRRSANLSEKQALERRIKRWETGNK